MADKISPASDGSHGDQFEAELPLPIGNAPRKHDKPAEVSAISGDPVVDLIRKKIARSYADAPDLVEEEKSVESLGPGATPSKHQLFLQNLAESGQPLPEAQSAWHEYYAGLGDDDKQQVWKEFYASHEAESSYRKDSEVAQAKDPHPSVFKPKSRRVTKVGRAFDDARRHSHDTLRVAKQLSPTSQGVRSLGFGLAIGSLVIAVFMFSFFNERLIAPLIQPSRTTTNVSIIASAKISKQPELLIPKINLAVPVVYGVTSTANDPVQEALKGGVLHYADTAQPGYSGNVVILGHSSSNILNPGRYKFAFVLLHKLAPGDIFYLQKNGKRYVYEVYIREIVSPNDVSVLGTRDQPATATLITCDPPGTSTNRLVVVGKQISPSPGTNRAIATRNMEAISSPIIPSNSPSLWSRLYEWLTH